MGEMRRQMMGVGIAKTLGSWNPEICMSCATNIWLLEDDYK